MKLLSFFLFFFLAAFSHAQHKQEVRAVWLTVNYALDWPDRPFQDGEDIKKQEAELNTILDQLKQTNINLVFMQTRIRGNVIYRSGLEPRNEYIRKNAATADYDPLAYAVEACHKRGIECHAWFVVYPLGPAKIGKKPNPAASHLSKDMIKTFKKDLYLDPGNPQTTDYLLSIIHEIVSAYDIDGIHFDYIRYPNGAHFPDDDTYKRNGKGEGKDNWRRENINRFVYAAYDTIKALKPWVQVSSSVVGMYKQIPGNTRRHWTAFSSVYQDPVDWLAKGKHDFIVPMMYFSGNLFFPFINDWVSRANGRFIVPGLGLYQMDHNESDWSAETILDQMQYSRENAAHGNALYRARYLLDNKKGISEEIRSHFYTGPALLPALTWLSNAIPVAPASVSAHKTDAFLHLDWDKIPQAGNQPVYYNLYRSETYPVDTNKPENLIATRIDTNHYEMLSDNQIETGYYYVITSYNRYHNESEPSRPCYFVTGNFEK